MRDHLAIFGNVSMIRSFCNACRRMALVIAGKMACCDAPHNAPPQKLKRVVSPEQTRRLPPAAERKAQLEAQDHRCIYCLNVFGSHVLCGVRMIRVLLNWDHVIPYAYSQNNYGRNFVAACRTCNALKSDHLFQTLDEAQIWITARRREKGFL